jgi:L-iditol 2-dehydrogenase
MKAVFLLKDGKLVYEEVKKPPLKGNWVLVRIDRCGLCGSDIQRIKNKEQWPAKKIVLGHEISGVVESVGNEKDFSKIGQRVIVMPLIPCNRCAFCKVGATELCMNLSSLGKNLSGGFAEYVAAPLENISKIPQNLSFELATITDVVATSVHCHNMLGEPKGMNVGIYGDGAVALACTLLMLKKGNRVTIIGKHNKNMQIARSFGSDVISFVEAKKLHNTFDYAIESVGRTQDATVNSAIIALQRKGTLAVCGVFRPDYLGGIRLRDIFSKEITLLGINSYGKYKGRSEFADALNFLCENKKSFSKIITHTFPLSCFKAGVAAAANKKRSGAIKVLFRPD